MHSPDCEHIDLHNSRLSPLPHRSTVRRYRDAGLDNPPGATGFTPGSQPYRGLALLTTWAMQVARVHRMPRSLDSIAAAWQLSSSKAKRSDESEDPAAAYASRKKAGGDGLSANASHMDIARRFVFNVRSRTNTHGNASRNFN